MKKLIVTVLLLSLVLMLGGCGETNEEEDPNFEEFGQGENSEEEEEGEEPEPTLEGLDLVIQALEEEFTVTDTESKPSEILGATEGVVLRIGRDPIELYEFDPEEETDVARDSIQKALTEGMVTIDGLDFSAVYNENRNVMLVDFENHPQGIEIKKLFEDL